MIRGLYKPLNSFIYLVFITIAPTKITVYCFIIKQILYSTVLTQKCGKRVDIYIIFPYQSNRIFTILKRYICVSSTSGIAILTLQAAI
jgi:hypothetical protein